MSDHILGMNFIADKWFSKLKICAYTLKHDHVPLKTVIESFNGQLFHIKYLFEVTKLIFSSFR